MRRRKKVTTCYYKMLLYETVNLFEFFVKMTPSLITTLLQIVLRNSTCHVNWAMVYFYRGERRWTNRSYLHRTRVRYRVKFIHENVKNNTNNSIIFRWILRRVPSQFDPDAGVLDRMLASEDNIRHDMGRERKWARRTTRTGRGRTKRTRQRTLFRIASSPRQRWDRIGRGAGANFRLSKSWTRDCNEHVPGDNDLSALTN